jgi:hypothetical protein
MELAVLLLVALAITLAVILIGSAAARFAEKRPEGFMTYPYLDLWDTYDAGDRGTFYGLAECRPEDKRAGPSYRMRPPAFRGRVVA